MDTKRGWSITTLHEWEACPFHYKCRRIDRLPEPKSPALDRGNLVHKEGEDYLKMGGKIPPIFRAFDIKGLRKKAYVAEELWSFDDGWRFLGTDYVRGAWFRLKMDAHKVIDDVLEVIDYKTGRVYDHHKEQAEVYCVSGLTRFTTVPKAHAEFWYTDSSQIIEKELDRTEVKGLQQSWGARANAMLKDTEFKPTPSDEACKWCKFKKAKGGPCKY